MANRPSKTIEEHPSSDHSWLSECFCGKLWEVHKVPNAPASFGGSALSSFSIVSTYTFQCPNIWLVSLAGAVYQQSSLLIVLWNAGLRDSGGRDLEVTHCAPPKKRSRFSIIFLYIYIYYLYIYLPWLAIWRQEKKNLLLSVYSFVFLLGFMSVGLVAGHWGEILCGQGRRIWHEENVAWRLQIQRSNGDTEKHPQLLRFRILHLVLQGSEQAMPSRSRRKVTWASHIRDRGDETPTVPADDIHWSQCLGKCGRFHYVPFPGKKKLKEKVEKEKEASEATRVVSTAWSRLRDMEVSR